MSKDKPPAHYIRFFQRGENYIKVVSWLLRTTFSGHAKVIMSIFVCSGLYLAAQAGAIGSIFYYARLVERGEKLFIPYWDISYVARDEPSLLWVTVVLSATLFLLSAGFLYLTRHMTLKVVQTNLYNRIQQALELTVHMPDPRAPISGRILSKHGYGRILSACRRSAMASRICGYAITAIVGSVGGLVILFVIDYKLTFFSMLLTLVLAVFLYPVAMRGASYSQNLDKSSHLAREELRDILAMSRWDSFPGLRSPEVVSDAFVGRLRVLDESTLVLQIGATVVVAFAIYYVADAMMSGEQAWASLIAYIGTLRIVLSGFSQVGRALTSVSRFYPEINHYRQFLEDAHGFSEKPLGELKEGQSIRLGKANNKEIIVKSGMRLALSNSGPFTLQEALFLEAKLVEGGLPVLAATVKDKSSLASPFPSILLFNVKNSNINEGRAPELAQNDRANITVYSYKYAKSVGSFGETHLLRADKGEFIEFLSLGSTESDELLGDIQKEDQANKDIRNTSFDEDMDDF